MGLESLPEICKKLMENGLPPTHPLAVVQQGTTPQQRVMIGTLADIHAAVTNAQFKPPSLVIVGEVVTLHHKLNWYQRAEPRD